MQDLSTTHGSNILLSERDKAHRLTLTRYELDLKGQAILVAMYHNAYVISPQTIFLDIMSEHDDIQFAYHLSSLCHLVMLDMQ
jgi:hypothetical protein